MATQYRTDTDKPRSVPSRENPEWWTEEHDSTWSRVKEALRRDWEQTRNDFGSDTARDLDQDVGDTVKQAAGKEPIPPRGEPNDLRSWEEAEPAVRFGHGARAYYADHDEWNDELERRLSDDWRRTRGTDLDPLVRAEMQHGWRLGAH